MLITEGDVLASLPEHIFFLYQGDDNFYWGGYVPPSLSTSHTAEGTTVRGVRGHAARKIFANFHIQTRIFVHSRGTFEVMLAKSLSPHPSLRP